MVTVLLWKGIRVLTRGIVDTPSRSLKATQRLRLAVTPKSSLVSGWRQLARWRSTQLSHDRDGRLETLFLLFPCHITIPSGRHPQSEPNAPDSITIRAPGHSGLLRGCETRHKFRQSHRLSVQMTTPVELPPEIAAQNKGPRIIVIVYVFTILASLFGAGRIFSRIRTLGRLAVDDYLILVSLVCNS
jgi:hypothetical protein